MRYIFLFLLAIFPTNCAAEGIDDQQQAECHHERTELTALAVLKIAKNLCQNRTPDVSCEETLDALFLATESISLRSSEGQFYYISKPPEGYIGGGISARLDPCTLEVVELHSYR